MPLQAFLQGTRLYQSQIHEIEMQELHRVYERMDLLLRVKIHRSRHDYRNLRIKKVERKGGK